VVGNLRSRPARAAPAENDAAPPAASGTHLVAVVSTVVEHPLFDLVSDDGHPAVSLLVGCPAIDEVTICPIDQGQGQGDLVEDGDQQLVGTGVRCWSATATARPESDHEDWLVTMSGHV